ncbi:MAG TPA: hypothetical protein PLQ85_11795 [Anaerolineae bacterium]|nr:hypothetical protein [Anaerolineae bacterium]
MATLTVNQITRDGVLYAVVAATPTGDQFPNDGRTLLAVYNGHGSASRTVSVNIQRDVDGQDPPDRTVTIGAGETRLIGPFPTGIYNDANGRVQLAYSDSAADMYVGVFKL